MSATITLAKERGSGLILHINEVNKEESLFFSCPDCKQEMIVVKSKLRKKDWHFRHKIDSSCTGARDKALHDYAEQILLNSNSIKISKNLQISYSNPRKEVSFLGKRSDVAVTYENEDVHFEIFVHHDLSQEKRDLYNTHKIKCVHINLSQPEWLTAAPEAIKEAILNQHRTKTVIYWNDESVSPKPEGFSLAKIFFGILAAIGLIYLFRKLFWRR